MLIVAPDTSAAVRTDRRTLRLSIAGIAAQNAGFDPRLYRARIEIGTLGVNGWVYRWSAEEHRGRFVLDDESCKAECLAEFVTEVDLSDHLPTLDPIVLNLGNTHDWGLETPAGPWR